MLKTYGFPVNFPLNQSIESSTVGPVGYGYGAAKPKRVMASSVVNKIAVPPLRP
jgi:hypothetical protein